MHGRARTRGGAAGTPGAGNPPGRTGPPGAASGGKPGPGGGREGGTAPAARGDSGIPGVTARGRAPPPPPAARYLAPAPAPAAARPRAPPASGGGPVTSHLPADVPGIPRHHRGRPRGDPPGSARTRWGPRTPASGAAGTGARPGGCGRCQPGGRAGASPGVRPGAPRGGIRPGVLGLLRVPEPPGAPFAAPSLCARAGGGGRVTLAAPAPGISCTPGEAAGPGWLRGRKPEPSHPSKARGVRGGSPSSH